MPPHFLRTSRIIPSLNATIYFLLPAYIHFHPNNLHWVSLNPTRANPLLGFAVLILDYVCFGLRNLVFPKTDSRHQPALYLLIPILLLVTGLAADSLLAWQWCQVIDNCYLQPLSIPTFLTIFFHVREDFRVITNAAIRIMPNKNK